MVEAPRAHDYGPAQLSAARCARSLNAVRVERLIYWRNKQIFLFLFVALLLTLPSLFLTFRTGTQTTPKGTPEVRNLHQEITDRIVARLRDGVCPWRQPWSGKGHGTMPRNAVTGRAYSGANVLLLWSRAQESGFADPRWLTFNQAREAGGNVRKGEKGECVIYVSKVIKTEDDGTKRAIPFLKSYYVFNVSQCENLPVKIIDPDAASHVVSPNTRDELADAFIASTGATIRHGEARAYYRPIGDFVNLPLFETFKNSSAYYGVAFHELGHWTGAEKRLNRTFGKRFGDQTYSAEELIAELTSAFLCGEFGFDNNGVDADYIATWIRFLTDHSGAIVTAAAAASRAVEFMRGLALEDEELEPLPLAA
jgi:antirestriction protein ArdC